MKTLQNNALPIFILFFLSVLAACQQKDTDNSISENIFPIRINNASHIQTRITDSGFEESEEIGLFVLDQSNSLTGNRHIDNMKVKYENGEWKPNEPIFYPSANDTCKFIAYYPYQESGIVAASSQITCNVQTNQSSAKNYSMSDFLVAEKSSIIPSINAVPLVFKHKMAKIKIKLIPGTGYNSAEELLNANPVISIREAATQATYDMNTATFANTTNLSNITLAGEFTIKDNELVGKYAIVVPQNIAGDKIFIEATAKGKNYIFTFGTKHTIAPATVETYTLTINDTALQGAINPSIDSWENSAEVNGNLNENTSTDGGQEPPLSANTYCIYIPDFSQSSVYKAMNGNTEIAEICREYLKGTGIDNQAIVVYPINEGIADLSKGYVAQVLEGNAGSPIQSQTHGGTVTWNNSTNTLSYQAGSFSAVSTVYIDKDGTISNSAIQGTPTVLSISPYTINDIRDSEVYPIVKIASQYWMGKNLHTTMFTNGTSISKPSTDEKWTKSIETSTATPAYCSSHISTDFLYNSTAALSNNIAPTGWDIPTSADWNKMIAYINNQVSVLKGNSWAENKSNLTGFTAEDTRCREKTGGYTSIPSSYFWHKDGHFKMLSSTTSPSSSKSEGYSIRCIRK